jgi:hypothetical protein
MCAFCEVQAGCENQLEKGEAFQELPRLDLAQDEIRADQDQGIAPVASSSGKDLIQECEALASVVTIRVPILEPLTVVPAVKLAITKL